MGLNGWLATLLQRCWKTLRDFSGLGVSPQPEKTGTDQIALPTVGQEIENADELLSRFLMQSKHFKKTGTLVTADAFMPPLDLELSTFLTTGLPDEEVWKLGLLVLEERRSSKLYGRADIDVGVVLAAKLKARFDNEPPRHVSVIGWPSYSEGKDFIKSQAQQLARACSLRLLQAPLTLPAKE
jgi:hypothetical protein